MQYFQIIINTLKKIKKANMKKSNLGDPDLPWGAI